MSNVFSQLAQDNNLDPVELDDVVNQAFDQLSEKYKQFDLEYDEDGVRITNFEDCDAEVTGGNDKEDVENNLTDELLKIANRISE